MKEVRNIQEQPTAPAVEGRRIVEGYALVFDTPSTGLRDFHEVIHRGALDGVLEQSDVFALLDHNQSRGVLARSNKGTGSLTLSIDERGLKYSFEVPDTALGAEVYQGVQRGDIAGSSFSFTVKKDRWERGGDGVVLRHIDEIAMLYDVSPVYRPAYDATSVSVDRRGLEALEAAEQQQAEETPAEERAQEVDENPSNSGGLESESTDNQPEERAEETEETPAEEAEEEQPAEESRSAQTETNNNSTHTHMPDFSLIKAINDVVNNRSLDATAEAVVAEGRAAFRANNQEAAGLSVPPVSEERAGETQTPTTTTPASDPIVAGTATKGKEAVATNKFSILGPLRSAMVLSQAGATYLTGLVGNIAIPFYSGSNCGWKGEVVAAEDGKGSFSEITMSPKRLTAFIDVSKQFLIQDSVGAEELLRRDIIAALAEKFEKTILGTEAGTDTKPAGIFNGVTADTAALTFADVVNLEAALENNNVTGALTYVVSPSAKATLRTTAKDTGSGRFVMEGAEVEGIRVLSSSAVTSKGVLLGDFRELIIGQWGGIDLTIDTLTKATEGMVRIVINAYFDAKVRRSAAFQKKILK